MRFLRIIGIVLAILIVLLVGFVAFVQFKPLTNHQGVTIHDISVDITPARLAQGKKLVDHNCAGCHQGNGTELEGMLFEDVEANQTFGDIYTSNITQDKTYGIGNYTDGELYRLFRTGVKKNGEVMLPVMPRLVSMADEDLYAIIAYLKNGKGMTEPSAKRHPKYHPSLLANVLLNFIIQPIPYKEKYPIKPDYQDSIRFGGYAVDALYGCFFCHSQSLQEWNYEDAKLTPGYLAGGTVFKFENHEVLSPSLLMDGQSNISNWTIKEFDSAVRYGQRPNDQPSYQKPMHPYPMMDSLEVRAIYYYLKDYSKNKNS